MGQRRGTILYIYIELQIIGSDLEHPLSKDDNHDFHYYLDRYAILISDTMKYIVSVNMIGKCDQCGLENVEISMVKSDRNKDLKLCNQCKPTDGAYGY